MRLFATILYAAAVLAASYGCFASVSLAIRLGYTRGWVAFCGIVAAALMTLGGWQQKDDES